MFKRKLPLIDYNFILKIKQDAYNDYKKNLNEWIIIKKDCFFNLETNKKEYFLKITPANEDMAFKSFLYEDSIEMYQVTKELYNKIQETDIIRLIFEKKEKENDEETEA